MLVMLGLNFASWFVGQFATYYVNVGLYAFVFLLNTALGVTIVLCHVMGNPKVSSTKKINQNVEKIVTFPGEHVCQENNEKVLHESVNLIVHYYSLLYTLLRNLE